MHNVFSNDANTKKKVQTSHTNLHHFVNHITMPLSSFVIVKELEECQEEVQKRRNESQKSSSVIAEHLKATEFHYLELILIL